MVLNTSQIILLAHRRTTLRRTTPQRCDERSPTRSRDFIWDDEGNPVAMIEAGAITYLHADHLGTPRRGTDAAGTVTWAWDGEAFGASAPSIAAVDVPLRFPGQILDADTGLVFNGWRTYVPQWGRYLESDPIGLAGGINTYAYADGSPTTKTDPLGLATFICKRPLGGKPGSWAPPLLNHTYVCVGGGPGNMSCGSTTASTDGIWPNVKEGSSGVPTTSDKDYYHPDACEKRWDEDSCIETCIANKLKKPTRPWYAVGPLGDDCQEYTSDVVQTCERSCARR